MTQRVKLWSMTGEPQRSWHNNSGGQKMTIQKPGRHGSKGAVDPWASSKENYEGCGGVHWAGCNKFTHQSDFVERGTSFQTHFPPVSGLVIVFGSNCNMRFGAPFHSGRHLLFLVGFCRTFLSAWFWQCWGLFLPFFTLSCRLSLHLERL